MRPQMDPGGLDLDVELSEPCAPLDGGDLRFATVAALLAWTERRLADARAILTGLPADLAGQDLARVSRRCEALAADVGHLREAASWREGGEGDEEQQRDGEGNEVHAPNIGRVPARGEPGR
jgi:hypothetical protein